MNKIKEKLTPELKKEIKSFVKEFKKLTKERKVIIGDVKNIKLIVGLSWESAITPDIVEYSVKDIKKTKEYIDFKNEIKDFCDRTEKWGKKNFNDKLWIWNNSLWCM